MLELDTVTAYRGPAQILRGVTLDVRGGEVVCLVGRNGAGKTTTMASVMGLLPVRSGVIRFRGQDITRLEPHLRARLGIGYAPDDTGVFPDLTVMENLMLGLWLGGRRGSTPRGSVFPAERARVAVVLDLFPELDALTGRRGLHLSGGEKKMVAIARAMTLEPSVLLLDEAFEGLAPVVVHRFAEAVQKIKDMGICLLIAESNVVTASLVADRLYIIDRGEIVFTGATREVLENDDVMKMIHG